ncbi:MAG: PEGA domain-containing protein [Myxococcota bacterium]
MKLRWIVYLFLGACAHVEPQERQRLPDYVPIHTEPGGAANAEYAAPDLVRDGPQPEMPTYAMASVPPARSLPPVAPAYATLDVSSAGADSTPCEVLVAGRPVGRTPAVAIEVAVGDALVQVVCEGRERYEATLNFRAGQKMTVVAMAATPELKAQRPQRKKKRKKRRRRRGKRR